MPRLPITVVTGFLGAGKTTLVERWLQELPRGEVAVIVNERGDVGVDGELLAARAARLTEITGGCVCCATRAELARALDAMARLAPPPRRVLVETSGDASPAGVVAAVRRGDNAERLRLDGIVTVLAASRAEQTMRFDVAVEQLGFADVVVLSHADRCTPEQLAELLSLVTRRAPGAVVAEARGGVVGDADHPTPLLGLLAAREQTLRLPPATSGHHPVEAVSLVAEGELDEERFGDWMEHSMAAVGARILRLKGIVAMHAVPARVVLQGVGGEVEVTLGPAWGDGVRGSRLVVIGLGLDAAELERGFLACVHETP